MSVVAALSCASSLSRELCAIALLATRLRDRPTLICARSKRAFAEASCVRSTLVSSSTSVCPSLTIWPDSKPMCVTTPGASFETETL